MRSQLNIRLNTEYKKKLKEIATDRDLTISATIRALINEEVKRINNEDDNSNNIKR